MILGMFIFVMQYQEQNSNVCETDKSISWIPIILQSLQTLQTI